jgi:hypothetical protein
LLDRISGRLGGRVATNIKEGLIKERGGEGEVRFCCVHARRKPVEFMERFAL